MSQAPALELTGVRRLFGGGFGRAPFAALDGASLRVEAGAIHGLVGASGSGKSTLARIAALLDRPDAGSVRLAGTEVAGRSPRALRPLRRGVQMVFQDPAGALNPRRRVGWSVAEPLHLLDERLGRAERERRVAAALARVGLEPDAAFRLPHAFSGGQRQRIAIARAVVAAPRLLVADEAVSALDASVQAQVLNLLLDLNQRDGLAVLFVGHDLAVIAAICSAVSVMDRGRIVETGPTARLFAEPEHAATRRLVEAARSG